MGPSSKAEQKVWNDGHVFSVNHDAQTGIHLWYLESEIKLFVGM